MARKHVARHVKKLQMHQQRHRKHVWKVFKKLARHKACYAKGGMMLYGMGMAKKKKAGMMLYGMGMRKAGYKKKKLKLPAWVTKPIPKTGKRFPNVPKGFSKKAGWFWNKHKKKAEKAQAKAKSFIGQMWDKAKKVGSNVVSSAVDTLGKHANTLLDKGSQLLNDHMDEFGDMANKFVDQQAEKYAQKASDKMDSYGKKKKGSGWTSGIGKGKRVRSGAGPVSYVPRMRIDRSQLLGSGRTMGSLGGVSRSNLISQAVAAATAARRRNTK